MKKIAITGAAGYVGLHLLKMLDESGFDILAVTKGNGPLLVKGKNIRVKQAHELTPQDQCDMVINLAFARSPLPEQNAQQNYDIAATLALLCHANSRIIHVSTLAVFGYLLDKEQERKPMAKRNDYMYVRSKIEMENLLLKNFASNELHIIRAGNVWGPASGWTNTLADALFYQLPLMYAATAYSNSTDVHNLCDYIHFLLGHTVSERFHHLAEFSQVSWQQLLSEMAAELKTTPQPLTQAPFYPTRAGEEFRHIFSFNPAKFLRSASRSRFFQQAAHALIRLVPQSLKKATRPPTKPLFETDTLTQWLLCCTTPFEHRVDTNWNAPLSARESMERVKAWLHEAGYVGG